MTSGHWDELQRLLTEVLDRSALERAPFLDRACAGRPELRQELTELLAASERESPLDGSVAALLEPPTVEPMREGMKIGHYQILERLGSGGMGVVYKARDLHLERILALKFLPARLSSDANAKERLRIEAQAAGALDHPNICTIHEIGETSDGQLFIAMSYYDGETIGTRLARGALAPDEAIGLVIQVAQGLAKAHERGVVHRDIKPANLMVNTDGVLKILDFGIAKVPGVQLSAPGQRVGTVAYMSPEQVRGEPLDGRTDVWSLGAVLYEMLTCERRFAGATYVAQVRAILDYRSAQERDRLPAIPEDLDRVLGGMLAEQPGGRFAASDLVRELEQLRAGRPDGDEVPEVLPGGERRRLTILCAAVPGFERADADVVVRRHGGLINSFGGGTLEALFGVPVTHEDDPVRAVRAALELGRLAGAGFRAGIHTGSFAVLPAGAAAPYRAAGASALLAADLCGQAPAGDIWLSADCRRAVAGLFATEEATSAAFKVLEASEPRTRFEAAQRAGLTEFIGRERELSTLRGALDAAASGEGRLVTLVGEAGMGKSRLLFELRFALEAAGIALLHGRCDSSEAATSYLPFVQILRDWLGTSGGERLTLDPGEVAARLMGLGGELEQLMPHLLQLLGIETEDFPVPRHLHREQARLAMQEALAAFVTLASRRQPTAILLDDWHWADEASHGVVQQVAELASGFPLLIVVTTRPGSGRSWGSPDHHLEISLDPLDARSSGSMLRSILRVTDVPAALADLVREHTGGNPFFLEEVTQALLEEEALVVDRGAVRLTRPPGQLMLPDTVQAVIRARLDRLDRETREVLRVASVIGREFTRGILERASDSGRLPHALQALKATGIIQQIRVVPEPAYRFKHVLTQEAALGSLLEHQRKELHGRVGEAIEARYRNGLDDHVGRLSEHFGRAEQWSKAVRYAGLAAARASALSQFGESLEILDRAQGWLLNLPDDAERRAMLTDILFRQERLCETLGLRGRQQRIIDELVTLLAQSNEPAHLAEAYLRQGDLSTLLRRFDDAEIALDHSLALRLELHDAIGQRNTLRSQGLLRWHQGRDDDALRCIEAALAIARERGDVEAQVGDLTNLGSVLRGTGEADEAMAVLEEALELSEQLESDLSLKRTFILHHLANVHRQLGDEARALEYLSQARTLTVEKRLPIQLSFHFTSTAHIYLRQGRVEESLELYREAVELTRRARFVPGLAQTLRFLGDVLLGVGREGEALAPLKEAAGLFGQLHDPVTEALLQAEVAKLHERAGDLESALAAWRRAHALQDRTGDLASALVVLEGLARVARRLLPEPSFALGYYSEALALAEELGDRAAAGRMHNGLGNIEWERGRYDQARAQYDAGLQIFRELNRAADAAVLLASLGVTLDAMGRSAEARAYLEEACTLHRQAGDRQAEARALGALTDLLRRMGEADRAIVCGEASLRLRRESGDRLGEGWMLQRLALAHGERGAGTAARECAAEAERIALETEDMELAAACRELSRV